MSSGPLTVWITRAEPGATLTADRVAAMGHEPLVAPLLRIETLPDVAVDLTGVAALAFTSSNGVRAFAELCPRRDLRVFAVGAGTTAAAKAAGFKAVLSADGDVAALAGRIAARRSELVGTVLHAAAAEPAADLLGALTPAGLEARSRLVTVEEPVAKRLDHVVERTRHVGDRLVAQQRVQAGQEATGRTHLAPVRVPRRGGAEPRAEQLVGAVNQVSSHGPSCLRHKPPPRRSALAPAGRSEEHRGTSP